MSHPSDPASHRADPVLLPLLIPDAVPIPWDDVSTSLHGIGNAAIATGLKVIVAPYEGMAIGDRLSVYWDDSGVPFASQLVDAGNLNQSIGLTLARCSFIDGDVQPFYRVERSGMADLDAPTRAIRVKLDRPGGNDPLPSTELYENLAAPQVPEDLLLNGIDAEKAAQGVDITLAQSPRNLSEPPTLDDIANELYAYVFTNEFINDNNGTLGGPDGDIANADLLWYRAQQKQQLTLDYQAHDGTDYQLIADYLAHPASNGRTVLGIHGYGSQAANAGAWAKVFYDQGYNVFTPDLRGHGRSADPSRSMGTLDTGDMLRWIDEIMKLDPDGEIVVIGVSLGAAVAMQLVSESQLPSNVFAIIEDCGYRTLREVVRKQIDTNAGSLTSDEKDQVFGKIDDLLLQKQGKRIADGLSEERLAAARLPLLAISGSSDQSVPPSMTADILSLYGGADKDMWIVQGAGHPSSIATENANYRLRVEAFLNYCQGYPYIAGVESRKTVIVGSEVDLLEGVTARDLLDGDLTASIEITGAVDTQAVGAYPITYSVTNSAGLTSAMESRIQVIAPRPPIPFYALSLTAPIGAPSSVFQGQANIDLEISVRSNNASELTQLDANGIAVIALFPDYQPFYDIGVANPTLVTLQPQEERTLSCNCTIGNDIPPGIYYLAVRINAENITDFVTCSGIDGVTPYTLIEVKANPQ